MPACNRIRKFGFENLEGKLTYVKIKSQGSRHRKRFERRKCEKRHTADAPPGRGASKENIDVLAESTINQEQRVIVGP